MRLRPISRTAQLHSPFALGAVVLSATLAYFWLSGTLFSDELPGFSMSSAQATGAALTYSTITAFLLGGLRYAQQQTAIILNQLVRSGTVEREVATPRAVMTPTRIH